MTRTILVPLDRSPGSEAVLLTVAELARAEGATVRLLHVAEPVSPVRSDDRIVAYVDQEAARVEDDVRGYLRTVAAGLEGLPIEMAVRFGEPVEEIIAEVRAACPDVIAMATHRRTGLRRILRSSVAERVERAARVPVILALHDGAAA